MDIELDAADMLKFEVILSTSVTADIWTEILLDGGGTFGMCFSKQIIQIHFLYNDKYWWKSLEFFKNKNSLNLFNNLI